MNNLFSIIFANIKRIFSKFVAKLKQLTSLTYLKALFNRTVGKFFTTLFDVKPKNKDDYYTVGNLMIGKKLCLAITVVISALALWYILQRLPAAVSSGSVKAQETIPTYKYSSMALKGFNGKANVLAERGYVAYIGDLADGRATGSGTLYGADGGEVYIGEFVENMYDGSGRLFYQGGDLKYDGQFKSNLYNGKGSLYNRGGKMQYNGDFADGLKHGNGTLYDGSVNPIFNGRFYRDVPQYTDFLGKTTADLANAFTGTRKLYTWDSFTCLSYPQLDVMYAVNTQTGDLSGDIKVGMLYVLNEKFTENGSKPLTKDELTQYFGKPIYDGYSFVQFPEIAAITELKTQLSYTGFAGIKKATYEHPYTELYNCTGFDAEGQLYIVTYTENSLVYTFYFEDSTQTYDFYSVEPE